MAVFSKKFGTASPGAEVAQMREHIAYMQEAIEFKMERMTRVQSSLELRVAALEEKLKGGNADGKA